MTDPDATVEVEVTPEMVRRIVVVQEDGRVTLARLIGPVNWFGSNVLTYRVDEED